MSPASKLAHVMAKPPSLPGSISRVAARSTSVLPSVWPAHGPAKSPRSAAVRTAGAVPAVGVVPLHAPADAPVDAPFDTGPVASVAHPAKPTATVNASISRTGPIAISQKPRPGIVRRGIHARQPVESVDRSPAGSTGNEIRLPDGRDRKSTRLKH